MPLKDKPKRTEDTSGEKVLAGLTGGTTDRTVTRSGRCPDCRYLIGSPGHEVTCGQPEPP